MEKGETLMQLNEEFLFCQAVLQQILQSGTGFSSGTCVSNGSDKLCTQWSDTSGDGNDFDQFLTSDMASIQPQNGLKGQTWPWN